jgi:hypothetical protein
MTTAPFRMGVFWGVNAGLVAVLFALQLWPLGIDIFQPDRAQALLLAGRVAAPDEAGLKIAHARAVPRYDVGLFGNSRALGVAGGEIGLNGRSFFNFGVSGSSLRQSVVLLEKLAAIGKAPRIAVVSLDHLELQYYSNPAYPPPPARWAGVLDDVELALTAPRLTAADRARLVWRHALNEWTELAALFNTERLRDRLSLWAPWLDDGRRAVRYRVDGSRETPPGATADPAPPERGRPAIIEAQLESDLARLAALRKAGTRVILYESPLEPHSAALFDREPSAHVAAQRAEIAATCRALALECHSPPLLDAAGTPWIDASHAPPRLLGRYIAGLIAGPAPKLGSVR